jgi:regulator of nucleoside diphosphate kinase
MQQADKSGSAGGKPPIHITDADYDVIADLPIQIEHRSPELSKMLLDEIERAEIHSIDAIPADAVRLGSEVEFFDEASGATRRVRLVLPFEADMEAGRMSILTPVGAGLIGLTVGQSIDWRLPDGRPRALKILAVDHAS